MIAISVAVFAVCASISAASLELFKGNVHELVRQISSHQREVIDEVFEFVDKIVGATFLSLAVALAISLYLLVTEVIEVRCR